MTALTASLATSTGAQRVHRAGADGPARPARQGMPAATQMRSDD